MLTAESIIKKIENNRDLINRYGVKRLGLFGSYTRNQQRLDSDIDIGVEFVNGKKTFDNYMGLKFLLEGLLKCNIDLVIISAIKPDLKHSIMRGIRYAKRI